MTAIRLFVTYVSIPSACFLVFGGDFWRQFLLINAILIAIHLDRKAT